MPLTEFFHAYEKILNAAISNTKHGRRQQEQGMCYLYLVCQGLYLLPYTSHPVLAPSVLSTNSKACIASMFTNLPSSRWKVFPSPFGSQLNPHHDEQREQLLWMIIVFARPQHHFFLVSSILLCGFENASFQCKLDRHNSKSPGCFCGVHSTENVVWDEDY